VLTTTQWLALDRIARVYGNGTMRATTRQTIQLHGVIKSNLKATLKAIDAELLNTIAACGDVNRNVMCNPNPYQSKAHAAALQLARDISNHLEPQTGAYREIWLDGEKIAGGEPEGEVEPIYGRTYLAAEIQDRGGGAALERRRPCSRTISASSRSLDDAGDISGLECDGRRRHGHDATASLTPIHAPPDLMGFCATRDADRDRGVVVTVQRDWGDRSNRKHATAEVHHRGPRARGVPRRGGESAQA
jgi:sulfite reductase (NADPH) hemoprotein beta-component